MRINIIQVYYALILFLFAISCQKGQSLVDDPENYVYSLLRLEAIYLDDTDTANVLVNDKPFSTIYKGSPNNPKLFPASDTSFHILIKSKSTGTVFLDTTLMADRNNDTTLYTFLLFNDRATVYTPPSNPAPGKIRIQLLNTCDVYNDVIDVTFFYIPSSGGTVPPSDTIGKLIVNLPLMALSEPVEMNVPPAGKVIRMRYTDHVSGRSLGSTSQNKLDILPSDYGRFHILQAFLDGTSGVPRNKFLYKRS
jgi:hypothetical protein